MYCNVWTPPFTPAAQRTFGLGWPQHNARLNGAQGFDLLLGSDVAYSLKALPSLFKTATALLSKRPSSVFLLGYVSRYLVIYTLACVMQRTHEDK